MITDDLQPLDGGRLGGEEDDGDGDDGGGGGGGGGHRDHVLFSVLSLSLSDSPFLHWSVVSHCHHSTGGGPRVAGSLSVQTAALTEPTHYRLETRDLPHLNSLSLYLQRRTPGYQA